MKKLIALLLAVVMCLCLVACGEGSEQGAGKINVASKAVGTWTGTTFYGDFTLVLNADMTGEYTEGKETIAITWFADEATRLVIINIPEEAYDYTQAFTYLESKDALYHHEVYCTREK